MVSIKTLTEVSSRCISWGKAAGAYAWQTCNFHVPEVLESGSLSLLEPSGPVQDCARFAVSDVYRKNVA